MIQNKENNKIIRNKAIKLLLENRKRINKKSLDKIIDKINNGNINNCISLSYLLNDKFKNNINFKDIEDINKKINNNDIEFNKINELFDNKLKNEDKKNNFEYLKNYKYNKEYSHSAKVILFKRVEELNKYRKHFINKNDNLKYEQIRALNVETVKDIEKYDKKYIYDYDKEFIKVVAILSQDKIFLEYYEKVKDYINLIVINSTLEDINIKNDNYKYLENLFNENNYNENVNNLIFSNYINYDINLNGNNLNEVINYKYSSYVEENYKINSCFINYIIEFYKNSFDKLYNNKRRYKPLTYNFLIELLQLDKDINYINIGLSINRAINNFFNKFSLGLDVINELGIIIYQYRPLKLNKNISPNIMRILLNNNNHIYLLNDNIKNFDKVKTQINYINELDNKKFIKLYDKQLKIKLYDRYPIKNKDYNENNIYMINDINDIINIIKDVKIKDIKKETFILIYNENLEHLLLNIYYEKYSPQVVYKDGNIINLKMLVNKNIFIIKNISFSSNESNIYINDVSIYKKIIKINDELTKQIINKKYMSYYNDKFYYIDKYYKIGPLSCYFDEEYKNYFYNAVDKNKCYSYSLSLINYIPCYSYFDNWQLYNNEELNDYYLYIVESLKDDIINNLIFNKKYSRCFGYLLNNVKSNIKYKIIYYKKPSNLYNVNFKYMIDNLYNNKICNDKDDKFILKFLINSLIGNLEKLKNKKTYSIIFNDYHKARAYAKIFNIKIHCINNINNIKYNNNNNLDENIINDDDNIIIKNNNNNNIDISDNKYLYIVSHEKEKDINEGFKPIKELIYNISHVILYNMYMKLINNNIKPLGVKTDAILIKEKYDDVKKLFKFDNDINNYKFENNKVLCKTKNIKEVNELLDIYNINEDNYIILNNEYDDNEIKNILDDKKNLIIVADTPGAGKTQLYINYTLNNNLKTIFITPFNNLCFKLKKKNIKAITINEFFKLGFNNDESNKTYNLNNIDVVIFDEVFLYNLNVLKLIDKLILDNKDNNIKFFSTGDNLQNEPINLNLNNVNDVNDYLKKAIYSIYDNRILLKVNKRLDNEEDKLKLMKLKEVIFNNETNYKNIIDKLKELDIKIINNYNLIDTKNNITYFNKRADKINKLIHEKYNDKDDYYYKGLKIKLRKHYIINNNNNEDIKNVKENIFKIDVNYIYKNKNYEYVNDIRLYINYVYKIVEKHNNYYLLIDYLNNCFIIDDEIINKYYSLNYCYTCFSLQGDTIANKYITIFDINTPYINKRFIYTALTRTNNLKYIQVFEHSKNELKILNSCKIKQYLINKINKYREIDIINNRAIEEDKYISIEWIIKTYDNILNDKFNLYCYNCNDKYYFYNNDGVISSNISFDRINNSQAHHIDNINILCKVCNSSKSNK